MAVAYAIFFILFSIFTVTHGERTFDKMYETINGAAACFRRLNGTHQFGCASHRTGNTGVIHIVNDMLEFEWLLKHAAAAPYMIVLPHLMFAWDVMVSLRDSDKISGVLVASNGSIDRPADFSPDDKCPNRYSGLSDQTHQTCDDQSAWNPRGNGLLLVDWGFPVFFIKDSDTLDKIEKCYMKHNAHDLDSQLSRSLCSLEMNSYMFAAVDSKTCIRRSNIANNIKPIRYCDPLGDVNIWSTLFPRSRKAAISNASVIMITTRLDSTSMFDEHAVGAVTPTSGIVTLIAVAELLSKMLPPDSADGVDANVLFTMLNGEAYDYIGSSRLIYDMQKEMFPVRQDSSLEDQTPIIQLKDIDLIVELGQLSKKESLFVHTANKSAQVQDFVTNLKEIGQKFNVNFAESSSNNIPPASLQTFLKEDPGMSGLVLADHDGTFTNKYYHSVYDDEQQLEYKFMNGTSIPKDSIQSYIANVSMTVALSVYQIITKKTYTGSVQANVTMIDELFHCYLDSANCSLFHACTNHADLDNKPLGHYVSVSVSANVLTALTGHVLAFLTGEEVKLNESSCEDSKTNTVYRRMWMVGWTSGEGNDSGVCIQTTMDSTLAVSPAFVIDDYDWASGKYSTWTESIWRDFTVRMFLKPSCAQETITFFVGLAVLLVSFVIVFFVNLRSDVLFGNSAVVAAAC